MYMLGTVLTRLLNKVISVISSAMILTLRMPSILIGALTTLKTRYAHLRLLLALTEPSTSRLRANLITVVRLTKQELITVQANLIALGQQLVTIVRPMPQYVRQCLLQIKDRLVVYTKLVRLHLSETLFALTPMVIQLIQGGKKQLETVRLNLQRVVQALKAKR